MPSAVPIDRVEPTVLLGHPNAARFTIAVLPDTQGEVKKPEDQRGERRAEWLLRHRQELGLVLALSVGDVINWDTPDHRSFKKASETFRILEQGGLPWLGVIGNHDTPAVSKGGKAPKGQSTKRALRDTRTFNEFFPPERFPLLSGVMEPGKIDNAFAVFRAAGADWLVLMLEMWPRRRSITWARAVCRAHADMNVILLTHMYLDERGRVTKDRGGYGATSPSYLRRKLIRRCPNIKIVLGGHKGFSPAHRFENHAGAPVAAWNNAWHHPKSNPVLLLTIDTAADTVSSRTYAPDTDEWLAPGDARFAGLGVIRKFNTSAA